MTARFKSGFKGTLPSRKLENPFSPLNDSWYGLVWSKKIDFRAFINFGHIFGSYKYCKIVTCPRKFQGFRAVRTYYPSSEDIIPRMILLKCGLRHFRRRISTRWRVKLLHCQKLYANNNVGFRLYLHLVRVMYVDSFA